MAKFRRITALVLVLIMSISLLGINVLASEDATPVVEQSEQASPANAESRGLLDTYKLTYYANNGTDDNYSGGNHKCLSSIYPLVDIDKTGFTKVGYEFAGWSKKPDGKKITSIIITEDTTLYAIWTPIPTSEQSVYVYAVDNGDPQATINTNGYYTIGKITLELPAPNETKYNSATGNQYDKYATAIDAALKDINYKGINNWLTVDNVEFFTLHCSSGATDFPSAQGATWHLDGNIKAMKTIFSVTYDANTGSGTMQGVNLEENSTFTVPASTFTPPTDKHFLKWNTAADGSGTGYDVGDTFAITANVTLYAIWEADAVTPPPVERVGFFVLLPGKAPVDGGADQGKGNYRPDQSGDSGVTGIDYSTGFTGGSLTDAGKKAFENGTIFNRDGVDPSYINVPKELGNYSAETLAAEGKKIVWFVIKTSSLSDTFPTPNTSKSDGIHVDGYITNVPITVNYYSNYPVNPATVPAKVVDKQDNGTDTLVSGDSHTVLALDATGIAAPADYTFDGWKDSEGTSYSPTDSTGTLMNSFSLYAQWEKVETPKFTTSYEWASATDGKDLPADFPTAPTDKNTYDTEAAARNGVDKTFTSDSVEYTATGMWTFSGWGEGALNGTNVAFTGTWEFTEATVTEDTASFTVNKVDETGDALKGAEFSLKNPAGKVTTGTTAADGRYVFANLTEGEYTLTETKAPDGYQKVDTVWTVTVAKGTATITGPNADTENVIHKIWNWIVKVTTGGSTENLLTADGVLTVTNSKVPGTFSIWSYDAKTGAAPKTPIYTETLPVGSELQYKGNTLTVDAINSIVTAEIVRQKVPGMRLESAYLDQANGNPDPNAWDGHKMLTVTDGKVTGGADVIASFKIKSGLETRLHLTWELPYTVTYVDGNGTTIQTNANTENYLYTGDAIPEYSGSNIPIKPSTPEADYYFAGTWKLTDGATSADGKIGSDNLVYTAEFTSVAKSYKVTYTVTGDAPDTYTTTSASHVYGSEVTVADKLTTTVNTKDGVYGKWTFSGWKNSEYSGKTFTMPAKNVEFTGTWAFAANGTHLVSYEFTGTYPASAKVPTAISYYAEAPVTVADSFVPVRDDASHTTWTFDGWVTPEGITEGTFTMPDKDVTITGKWTPKIDPQYRITYKIEGNYFTTDEYKTQELFAGDTIALHTAEAHDFYTFSGWKLEYAPAAETRAMAAGADDKSFEGKTMPAHDLIAVGSYTYNPPYIPDVPTPTPTPTPPVETIDPGEVPLVPGPEETIDPDATPLDPSPKTGDSADIALLWLVFCASFCGLVVIGVTAPKKRNDR